jgi:hypothetical protein
MSKAKPITVGTRKFRSLTEAAKHFSKMLNRYKPGEPVNQEDFEHLLPLLKLNPEYKEKVGEAEVVGFDIDTAAHGTNCFYAQLSDGTRVHFSYKRCLGLKGDDNGSANDAQPDLFVSKDPR